MTSKTITLNVSERVSALGILNAFKGSLEKLAFILDDIKGLVITEEEWTKADRKIEPTPTAEDPARVTYTWDNEKGGDKEVVLSETSVEYLRTTIKERDEKGEFGIHDKAFIDLHKKLL